MLLEESVVNSRSEYPAGSALTNANRSRNAEPASKVHATRDAQQPASEHGQTDEPNGAERMPRNGVEADGQGDVRRGADQAQVEPVSYQGQ